MSMRNRQKQHGLKSLTNGDFCQYWRTRSAISPANGAGQIANQAGYTLSLLCSHPLCLAHGIEMAGSLLKRDLKKQKPGPKVLGGNN